MYKTASGYRRISKFDRK